MLSFDFFLVRNMFLDFHSMILSLLLPKGGNATNLTKMSKNLNDQQLIVEGYTEPSQVHTIIFLALSRAFLFGGIFVIILLCFL